MKITALQYARAWYHMLRTNPSTTRDTLAQMLLRQLHFAGKLKLLPEILRLMKYIELEETGATAVTVTAARPPADQTIHTVLEHTLGHTNAEVALKIDPQAIGGMRVRTENEQWDLTIAGQLKRLQKQVIN